MFTIVNMRSLEVDRTARARIRDHALRLFAERGPDAVTVRDIAGAAAVSPALVMRHYRSKDGLREVVDEYVASVFGSLLEQVTRADEAGVFDAGRSRSLAELVVEQLPADSAVRKLLPQPQPETALGLFTVKPAPMRVSR